MWQSGNMLIAMPYDRNKNILNDLSPIIPRKNTWTKNFQKQKLVSIISAKFTWYVNFGKSKQAKKPKITN